MDIIVADVIKRISLVRRRSGMSPDEFEDYWRTTHVNLVRRLPGLRGYRINPTRTWTPPGGPPGQLWDGVAEVWFDTVDDLDAAFASLADEMAADRRNFVEEVAVSIVDEVVVIREPDR